MSSTNSDLNDKIKTLKRRRDFLSKRVMDYQGKDASRDKAEESALNFAITVIESNYESATDILAELRRKRREEPESDPLQSK